MGKCFYPDELRAEAIFMHEAGMGYKSIASELGLERDTVRNWIVLYNKTGRMSRKKQMTSKEQAEALRLLREKVQRKNKPDIYREAREEYEQSVENMSSIARKHGVSEHGFMGYLSRNHPESTLLHVYARYRKTVQDDVAADVAKAQARGEVLLKKMSEELDKKLARIEKEKKV